MSKLRILNVIVQPVLVVDDGEELHDGPTIQPISIPLSQLATLIDRIPTELVQLQAQYDAQSGCD